MLTTTLMAALMISEPERLAGLGLAISPSGGGQLQSD